MKCCTLFRSRSPSSRRKHGATGVFPGKRHLLDGERAFRRENVIFSTENARSDEKTSSSRRRTRLPTRKRHLLDGERACRRENVIFSTENAPSDEKNPSCRRSMRPPTRKRHLLD